MIFIYFLLDFIKKSLIHGMYFDTRVYIPGLELSHELLPKEVTPMVSYCPSEPILIKGPPEV